MQGESSLLCKDLLVNGHLLIRGVLGVYAGICRTPTSGVFCQCILTVSHL